MGEILVVGAGLSGAALARSLADAGRRVLTIDERGYVGGNCYSRRDAETGVMVHVHGPHIFHTDNESVWDFIRRFGIFEPFVHRVKSIYRERLFSMPINLATINALFDRQMTPTEAEALVKSRTVTPAETPHNFEEQALALIGPELYQAFFYGYTKKQWGCEPRELPADILKRLPLRFNDDDRYFAHRHQAIPRDGYTQLVSNMLNDSKITIRLNQEYEPQMESDFEHVFYTGALDRYFGYRYGRLPYRTLDFEWFTVEGDHQKHPVINYTEAEVPWTRIVEHKHFAYWENHAVSLCHREYSRAAEGADLPYYPVRFAAANPQLERYLQLAEQEGRVTFVGRLGRFRYLDMDQALAEALAAAELYLKREQ